MHAFLFRFYLLVLGHFCSWDPSVLPAHSHTHCEPALQLIGDTLPTHLPCPLPDLFPKHLLPITPPHRLTHLPTPVFLPTPTNILSTHPLLLTCTVPPPNLHLRLPPLPFPLCVAIPRHTPTFHHCLPHDPLPSHLPFPTGILPFSPRFPFWRLRFRLWTFLAMAWLSVWVLFSQRVSAWCAANFPFPHRSHSSYQRFDVVCSFYLPVLAVLPVDSAAFPAPTPLVCVSCLSSTPYCLTSFLLVRAFCQTGFLPLWLCAVCVSSPIYSRLRVSGVFLFPFRVLFLLCACDALVSRSLRYRCFLPPPPVFAWTSFTYACHCALW